MSRRIMHVVLTPRFSGAETLVVRLASEHLNAGHAVSVASLNPPEDDFRSEIELSSKSGVDWLTPAHPLRGWSRLRYLRKMVEVWRPDAVVAHSVLPSAYVRVALFLHRVPVISVLHSSTNDDYHDPKFLASEFILNFKAARVVTVSEQAALNYRRRVGGRRSAGGQVVTIANGISLATYQTPTVSREEVRAHLGATPEALVILQVGRLNSVKRQDTTVRALQALRQTRNAVLWLAGIEEDPEYVRVLRNLVDELELQPQVQFLGPRRDVPDLLHAADVYAMPSAAEAHSVAMLEALASGIPVVASDIPQFSFARSYPGVLICDPVDTREYADLMNSFETGQRFERDLSELSIQGTARKYETLVDAVAERTAGSTP